MLLRIFAVLFLVNVSSQSRLEVEPLNRSAYTNNEFLTIVDKPSDDGRYWFSHYNFKKKLDYFFIQISLRILRLKITPVNETVDLCNAVGAKNIFARQYISFLTKSMKPELKCPVFGDYLWTNDTQVGLEKSFPFVPPAMKSFGRSLVNVTIQYSTVFAGKRCIVMKYSATYKAQIK